MSLSGWCSQLGTPDCAGCRSPMCSHHCHDDRHAAGPAPGPAETVVLTTNAL